MPRSSRSISARKSRKTLTRRDTSTGDRSVSSEEAIKAGEQIAMAAFSSGLKLAAAFGTVAAKTASLALASLASGADKFSEMVREEAGRSNGTKFGGQQRATARTVRTIARSKRRKRRS